MYQRSGTGALKGIQLRGLWADSAVVLGYSGQFGGSCTITATGLIIGQVLLHLMLFICVEIGYTLQIFVIEEAVCL